MESKNKHEWTDVKILEKGGSGWFQVPRFWIDDLMGAHCGYALGRKSPRICNSFWKYIFYLWRWIASTPTRKTKISIDSFPCRADAAVRWTAALMVSGLFDITVGRYTPKHDEPTEFRYRVNASQDEWRAFIMALDLTVNTLQGTLTNFKKESKGRNYNRWGNNSAFKVELAFNVDAVRREQFALPPVNTQFLQAAADGKIKDQLGRPIAQRNTEGGIEALYYATTRRKRPGEREEDYIYRTIAEDRTRLESGF